MNPIIRLLGHLLSCKDATRFLSRAEDQALPGFVRWKLRMHLAVCIKCRRFVAQLALMRRAIKAWTQ